MHAVHTKFISGLAFNAQIGNHNVLMDSSETGADTGASPKKLMLAALAGCTGIDVVSILNKMKVPFSDLAIDVTAALTDIHPKMYKEVTVNYQIRVQNDHRKNVLKAVKLSQDKYCGVYAMFTAFSTVTSQVTFLD
jgi:putative redox protein